MYDPTNAERQRRWRARQSGKLPVEKPPVCKQCGRLLNRKKSSRINLDNSSLCFKCWILTPDGREYNRQRAAEYKAKRKQT